eukprot:gene822-460_t
MLEKGGDVNAIDRRRVEKKLTSRRCFIVCPTQRHQTRARKGGKGKRKKEGGAALQSNHKGEEATHASRTFTRVRLATRKLLPLISLHSPKGGEKIKKKRKKKRRRRIQIETERATGYKLVFLVVVTQRTRRIHILFQFSLLFVCLKSVAVYLPFISCSSAASYPSFVQLMQWYMSHSSV